MTRRRSSTITRRIPHTGGAGVPPAEPFRFKAKLESSSDPIPPLDPALLRGSINTLRHAKRTIIHSVCAHADRIHGLLPHLTCTIGGLDELLSLLAYALPPEART